jgi:hypothetical protein
MVDYGNNTGDNKYNRFACDINDDPYQEDIRKQSGFRVRDTTLAKIFKDMVINYDGSKELNTNSYFPSPGNKLPGGIYKDQNGQQIKPASWIWQSY